MSAYKLTARAKQVLSLSKKEAQLLKNKYAGTEHLLLGILNIGDSVVTDVLTYFNVDLEELRNIIYDNILQKGDISINLDDISFTPRVEKVVDLANTFVKRLNKTHIDIEHLFLSLLYESGGTATAILSPLGINYDTVKEIIENEFKNIDTESNVENYLNNLPHNYDDLDVRNFKNLHKYGRNLTYEAAKGNISPCVGRSSEMYKIIKILCRKNKNNPLLLGEAGTGKTAVVEGLAHLIVAGKVPEILLNKHIFSIDVPGMVAGTKYRGQFEERVKGLMDEAMDNRNIIIFLDEIHLIVGAGAAQGSVDVSGIIKPALARGELMCIGATTYDEYRTSIEQDKALDRRFHTVRIVEPSVQDAITILNGSKESYEKFHGVTYTKECINAAVRLTKRYIPDRYLPDKAFDVLDEAGAANHILCEHVEEIYDLRETIRNTRLKKDQLIAQQKFEEACLVRDEEKKLLQSITALVDEKNRVRSKSVEITEKHIEEVVKSITGIPVSVDESDHIKKVLALETVLNSCVFGQDDAVKRICNSLKRSTAKINDPNRPIGSFLFVGTTGVGKTYLSKMLTRQLFTTEDIMIQVDMSEFMESHSVSKLIGAPPGYIGYDKGSKFIEKVRRNPFNVILFDEIEKAHPEVLGILLQILEEGQVTDATGKIANFKNSVIVMTTNAGSEQAEAQQLGFGAQPAKQNTNINSEKIIETVKKSFKPEFLNRIDDIVIFNKLSKINIEKIVQYHFNKYASRIKEVYSVIVELDKTASDFFIETGYDDKYGARELKRKMQQDFETKIAEALLVGQFKSGDTVICKCENKEIVLVKKELTTNEVQV